MSLNIRLSDGTDPGHANPGTLIEGVVTLDLSKQKTIANANISFIGKIVTEYSEVRIGSAGNTHGPRRHAEERIVLLEYNTVFFPGPFAVPSQIFEWPFRFEIPTTVDCYRRSIDSNVSQETAIFAKNGICNLPPTFGWRDSTTTHLVSARIKYRLIASVDIGSGFFKRVTRHKLPIVISNVAKTKIRMPLLPPRKWYRIRAYQLTLGERCPFKATIHFSDGLPIPYAEIESDFNEGCVMADSDPYAFQLRFQRRSSRGETSSAVKPTDICVTAVSLTLNRNVAVHVAPTQRHVRNVGTKMIASGGQGYTTEDILVARSNIEFPVFDKFERRPNTVKSTDMTIRATYNLTGWARLVSDHLTQCTERDSRSDRSAGERKTSNVAGFRCYTISVQHNVTVAVSVRDDTTPNRETFTAKIDIPIHIDGSSSHESDAGEHTNGVTAQEEQMREKNANNESAGTPSKEQEARQARTENAHRRYDKAEVELPQYEENAEPPPPI